MLLGTRSHILAPGTEIGSVPCLMEFTLRHCNMSCHLKRAEKDYSILCKFLQQDFVCFYDILIRSCLFRKVPEMLKICYLKDPFMYMIYFAIDSFTAEHLF